METNASIGIEGLGCCAILQEVFQVANPLEVFARHGYWWDSEKIVKVLIEDYGCRLKQGPPMPGDIVVSGMHPGIVLRGGKVAQMIRGRRLISDLKRWSIKVVLCR
jgi:hypothetical protein